MNKRSANTLKNLLIAAVVLNMLVIVMQVYNTAATIKTARGSLILLGKSALSTFEGGRRAMLALSPQYAERFKQYLNSADRESAVLSIYLVSEDGEVILNTGDIEPPKFEPGENGILDTDKGIFVFRRLKPHLPGMGAGPAMMQGMMGYGRMGRELREKIDTEKLPRLTAAALVDSSTLNSVRNSELSFLAAVIFLQIILVAVFLYAAKLIKMGNEQEQIIQAQEREAQMGKMSLVMAHELKNPLSSVKGLIEFSAKKSEGSQKDIALRCVDELSRLDRIVNDFLTYGRDMTPETAPTDVFALITDTAKLLELDAASKSVTISIEGAPSLIQADASKMKQVFFNLLLNAVQAAPEHSVISVNTTPHSAVITNEIKDGSFEADKIGQPFYTTKTVGTGLGIAIVKRILALHGFELRIKAEKLFTASVFFKEFTHLK